MIRCQKCGYTNQNTAVKCVKCLTVLAQPEPVVAAPPQTSNSNHTQGDVKFNRPAWDAKTNGMELRQPVPVVVPSSDAGKTMRRFVPSSRPCALVALSMDEQELRAIPVKGENVVLNRDLLDAGNTSLSRSGHASLVYRDGAWWLDNLTDLKTTFIQVNHPVKLADGDVLLLGDTLYRFKEGS